MATALHCPLTAVPASTPPRTIHTAEHPAYSPAAATPPSAPALHLCYVSVPPSTPPPTPPAVWPPPRTPGAALPAATMPHTVLAAAPPSFVGGDCSCVGGDCS